MTLFKLWNIKKLDRTKDNIKIAQFNDKSDEEAGLPDSDDENKPESLAIKHHQGGAMP